LRNASSGFTVKRQQYTARHRGSSPGIRLIGAGSKPRHARTGSGGYFTNAASVRARVHMIKVETAAGTRRLQAQ